jgi:hypothetical protein
MQGTAQIEGVNVLTYPEKHVELTVDNYGYEPGQPLAHGSSAAPAAANGAARGLVNRGGARYSEDVDRDELVRVLRAFELTGLEYVLIGATAMGFHGLVRATEDVDLFIRATAENVERLRQALRSTYPGDPHVEDIRADDLLGEYPAVRYYPPDADLFFDVMTRLGEASSFETVEAEVKEFEGIRVCVATPRALYRMKKGTVRPLDRQDASALRDRFNLTDED